VRWDRGGEAGVALKFKVSFPEYLFLAFFHDQLSPMVRVLPTPCIVEEGKTLPKEDEVRLANPPGVTTSGELGAALSVGPVKISAIIVRQGYT